MHQIHLVQITCWERDSELVMKSLVSDHSVEHMLESISKGKMKLQSK